MDGADVGVIEGGRRTGFSFEPLDSLSVVDDVGRQELQRHLTLEGGVLGPVDHTHTSAPDLFEDFVVGYGLADHLLFNLPAALRIGLSR